MRHFTFKPLSLALLAMMSAGTLSAQDTTGGSTGKEMRLLIGSESYGTTTGDYTGMAYYERYFYDNEGKLSRRAAYGRDYKSGLFDMTKLYYFEYNDFGQLTWTYYRQKGAYDISENNVFKATAADSVKYEYNDEHQLVKKTDGVFYTVYEYDSDGNVVKETARYNSNDKIYQQLTYQEFAGKGLPTKVESTSEVYAYNNYSEDREYNKAGQLVKSEVYNPDEIADPDTGMPIEVKNVKAVYKADYYDNGDEKWHVNYAKLFEDGELLPNDSVAYIREDGNPDRLMEKAYSWYIDSWSEYNTYVVYQYRTFDPTYAADISVTTDKDKFNCNKLQFKIPDFAQAGNYKFDIYRDGEKIASADFTDPNAVDPTTMVYTFVDDSLRNDYHDYFVQTLIGDELGTEYLEIGTSNLVRVVNHTDLPCVENLRITNCTAADGIYYVTLAWDGISDEVAKKYGFKRYDVVQKDYKAADNSESDGLATEWTINAPHAKFSAVFDVQCSYPYGRSHCYIDVVVKDILAGISQTVAGDVETTYTAHVLHLSKAADVKVYNTSGALVANEKGTTSVSLEGQPHGTYLLLIGNGSNVSVRKVVR